MFRKFKSNFGYGEVICISVILTLCVYLFFLFVLFNSTIGVHQDEIEQEVVVKEGEYDYSISYDGGNFKQTSDLNAPLNNSTKSAIIFYKYPEWNIPSVMWEDKVLTLNGSRFDGNLIYYTRDDGECMYTYTPFIMITNSAYVSQDVEFITLSIEDGIGAVEVLRQFRDKMTMDSIILVKTYNGRPIAILQGNDFNGNLLSPCRFMETFSFSNNAYYVTFYKLTYDVYSLADIDFMLENDSTPYKVGGVQVSNASTAILYNKDGSIDKIIEDYTGSLNVEKVNENTFTSYVVQDDEKLYCSGPSLVVENGIDVVVGNLEIDIANGLSIDDIQSKYMDFITKNYYVIIKSQVTGNALCILQANAINISTFIDNGDSNILTVVLEGKRVYAYGAIADICSV